jgi:hypothetical protein
MCTSCMDIMTLVHDDTTIPNMTLAKVVLDTLRTTAYNHDKVHITDAEMATFLIVLGSSLLVWEDTRS